MPLSIEPRHVVYTYRVVLLCDICDNLEGLNKTVCISDPVMPLLLADAAVDRFVMSTVDAVTVPFARPVIPLT